MLAALFSPPAARAQPLPADYQEVLATLGRTGDFKDGVLKVNIPRTDLAVTIRNRPAPTSFGFGGWVAFTRGDHGMDVMMGDLVLAENEVNPVMSAVLDQGLEVTALHNHFFHESPRVFFMHVHGMGRAADLARKLKPAVALIDTAMKARGAPPAAPPAAGAPIDTASIARIVGHPGEQSGGVYKITIGRPDIAMREHGAAINARMGLNTWAAFTGTADDAMVAGDFAVLEPELTGVLRTLRANGIEIVAIHHHMTGVAPMVVFLHYFGVGPAEALARAVQSALEPPRVVFACQKGAAKSLVAAAFFNKLAADRGLDVRAAFRGIDPQETVNASMVEGLRRDGIAVPQGSPSALTDRDIASASRVVALGAALPTSAAGKGVTWHDVPGDSYEAMRDAVVKRVTELLDELR
jgi:protein-tyrosine-phosphatase